MKNLFPKVIKIGRKKGLPDYLELDYIIENINEEKSSYSYYQYIGAGAVLPNWKGDKLMGKVRKLIKHDESSICEL